jgi:hypothetical protein
MRGQYIRSRTQWIEEGEKPTIIVFDFQLILVYHYMGSLLRD